MRISVAGLRCTLLTVLAGCATIPPQHVDDLCSVFKQNPHWYTEARDVEHRWHIPVVVQMAIMHQESKFNAYAKPPRTKLLGFIPWSRPSTAYGYAQALDGTWALYAKSSGDWFASRTRFSDGVDFIGWYANQANRRAGIRRDDAYRLYLAYHEGIGGYLAHTYQQKTWLLQVAHKVQARAMTYQAQLNHCHPPS